VASPASVSPAPSRSRVALPARLTPGWASAAAPRKRFQPFLPEDQPWKEPGAQRLQAPGRREWESFLVRALPEPATPNQRTRLAMRVSGDILLIALAIGIVDGLRALSYSAVRHEPIWSFASLLLSRSAIGLWGLYGVLFTLLGYSERLYHPETVRDPQSERFILLKAVFWSTLLTGICFSVSGIHTISAVTLVAGAALGAVLMLKWRGHSRRVSAPRNRTHRDARNVLIIGAGRLGRRLASRLEQGTIRSCVVRGFLDEHEPVGGDIRGRVEDMARVARSEFIDEIILAVPAYSEAAQKAIWEARRNRLDIRLVPDLLGFDPAGVVMENLGGVPVLTLFEEPIPGFELLLKRVADFMLAAMGLTLAAPLLAAIALAIKLDSAGPVLYCAPRLGFKGRRFLCYKFRTMRTDADQLKEKLRAHNEREGAIFKIAGDPRVTRVGRILRRYSLDELPQLWNVVRGEMSLVGPRPHPLDDAARYGLDDFQRLEVTPGLTGLWQVTARGDPSFQRSVALDREYIGNWSLRMDLRILCKTVRTILRGEGV